MFGHNKFDYSRIASKKTLDIGCGRKKLEGSVGLDAMALPGVDIISDLNKPLPLDDASFDVVHANQVLEHVDDLIALMKEIHRVLKPGGLLVAHTPYFRSAWADIDPTHVRGFTICTLDYFVAGTYCSENYRFNESIFQKREVYLDQDYSSNPLRGIFATVALRWPFRFENSILSFLYPFEQITYVLKK